jgi:ribosomal protein S18 acetylase RimI-like enzyme
MSHHTHAPAIRRAGLTDASALADLGRRTFADTFGADNSADDLRAYLDGAYAEPIQRQELASSDLTYFLAEADGVPVGFALLRRDNSSPFVDDPTAIELQRLYVDRVWHGSGLAQALMATCVQHAVARGAGSLFLGVWERNAKALRFYAAQGFVVVGSQRFMVGSDAQTDLVMWRRLVD